jgi:hypothetical protein
VTIGKPLGQALKYRHPMSMRSKYVKSGGKQTPPHQFVIALNETECEMIMNAVKIKHCGESDREWFHIVVYPKSYTPI